MGSRANFGTSSPTRLFINCPLQSLCVFVCMSALTKACILPEVLFALLVHVSVYTCVVTQLQGEPSVNEKPIEL